MGEPNYDDSSNGEGRPEEGRDDVSHPPPFDIPMSKSWVFVGGNAHELLALCVALCKGQLDFGRMALCSHHISAKCRNPHSR